MLTQCHVALQTDFFVNSDLEIKHSLIGNLKGDNNLRVRTLDSFFFSVQKFEIGPPVVQVSEPHSLALLNSYTNTGAMTISEQTKILIY